MPIFFIFAAIFLALPALEVLFFFWIAARVGFFLALALLILGATLGIGLLQGQNIRRFSALHSKSMVLGKNLHITINTAMDSMFDELCIAAAAILLIVPGFLTDAIALFLLLPPVRGRLKAGHRSNRKPDDGIIEVDFERID